MKLNQLSHKYQRLICLLTISLFFMVLFLNFGKYQGFLSSSYNSGILSQGDHGRDLYVFQETYFGQLPYQDYFWNYGPLMPYYYALFMKLFGLSMLSVLIGKAILIYLTGIFIFLTLSLFYPSSVGLLGSLWFYVFYDDFFYTYNHIGGIALILAIVFSFFSYIQKNNNSYLYIALFLTTLLTFVKLNMGLVVFSWLLFSVVFFDIFNWKKLLSDNKIYFCCSVCLFPAIVFGVYYFLVRGLPFYEIKQFFPYLGMFQFFSETSSANPFQLLVRITRNLVMSSWLHIFATLLIGLALINLLISQFNRQVLKTSHRHEGKAIITTFLLAGLLMHEYFLSGADYHIYWSIPVCILLMFKIIGISFSILNIRSKIFMYAGLGIIWLATFYAKIPIPLTLQHPAFSFPTAKGQIYIANHPSWTHTVTQTTKFLNANLKKDESFFAIPYDALYYYLTEKRSPVKLFFFHKSMKIPLIQENAIIKELKKKTVNWILLSSSYKSKLYWDKDKGVQYCRTLWDYIEDNYEEVQRFGNWEKEGGWATPHGTIILKKIIKTELSSLNKGNGRK